MRAKYRTGIMIIVSLLIVDNRDIKPENFMLKNKDDINCIKLIDFGLSKDYSGQEVMGTPSGSVTYHI